MLTLQPVDDASRSILHHLFIHYFVALSEFDPNLTINVYGLPAWIPHGLPGPTSWQECIEQNWWIRADCDQWLFFKDQQTLAGFAIVFTDPARLSPGVDIELVDFYIVPEQRGTGLAREAALSIFERYRGMWQVFSAGKKYACSSLLGTCHWRVYTRCL